MFFVPKHLHCPASMIYLQEHMSSYFSPLIQQTITNQGGL